MTRVRPLAAHQIERLLAARQVVAFNADVDRSLLSGVCRRHGLPPLDTVIWEDARDPYSAWCGQWSSYWHDDTWQPPPHIGGAHAAAADGLAADLPAAAAVAAPIHARRAAIKERDPHRRATVRADEEPF